MVILTFNGFAFFMEFIYLYLLYCGMMSLHKIMIFAYGGFMVASFPLYMWIVIGNVGGFGCGLLLFI